MLNGEHKRIVKYILVHEVIFRMSGNERLVTVLRRLQMPVYRRRFCDFFDPDNRKR